MKKSYSPFMRNDIIELNVTDIGINGEGIAHVDGYTVFVKGALKGERVKAKVILAKPTYAIAILEKIVKTSDVRVKPECEYFGKCGGCTMQHLKYGSQIECKNNFVMSAFKKIAKLGVQIDETIVSDKTYRYRNKLSLPIRANALSNTKKRKQAELEKGSRYVAKEQVPHCNVKVGFFRAGTHDVIDIDDCRLQMTSYGELIRELKNYMTDRNIAGYDELTGEGDLRHITIRFLEGKQTVCLVGLDKDGRKYTSFGRILEKLYGENYALFYNHNAENTNAIYGKNFMFLCGKNEPVSVDNLILDIHPAGFFQVNDFIRGELYEAVSALVAAQNASCVIEAYAGAGTLACKLAKSAKKVYAIEVNKDSVIAFNNIAKLNNITNVEMIKGDCKDELVNLLKSGKVDADNTVLILDPPRAGISQAEAAAIENSGIKHIIYVSCSYSSLARDVKNIGDKYEVALLKTFDMFPQTSGIETLAMLRLKS